MCASDVRSSWLVIAPTQWNTVHLLVGAIMPKDISNYLALMVKNGASDIFFTCGAPISLSIDGVIRPVGHEVLDSLGCRQLIYSVLSDDQIKEFEENFELNMGISFKGIGRFRANVFRQKGEVAMVLRHVKDKVPSVKELGLPKVLQQLIAEKSGLVLVVGATGSGKSTTLATMIDYRNTHSQSHIITIENPIEFIHQHKKSLVDQREVGLDTRSYDQALENVLREAPNVIVIGEIRDAAAMKHALHYSETGHLCLSTLHASNALQAFERIMNFFPHDAHQSVRMDLSQHLKGIVAQRLIRKKGGGRVPAVEVLINSPYISELIKDGRFSEMRDAMARSEGEGMITFDEALLELVHAELIEPEEALKHADSRNNLALKLRLEKGFADDAGDELRISE